MLDIKEVERAIAELEDGNTTFSSCAKLADLYAVRDHITGQSQVYERAYSQAASQSEKLDAYGDSDFLKTIEGKDNTAVWGIIDNLMDTLRIVNPRVYESVIRKITNL